MNVAELSSAGPKRPTAALEEKTTVWSDENRDQPECHPENPKPTEPVVQCHRVL